MMQRTLTNRWALVAFGLILALLFSACNAQTPVEVTATEPGSGIDVAPVVSATGVVVPSQQSTMSFPIGGTIAELLVEEGTTVQQGDEIARLDATLLDADVAEAEAAVAIAQANLQQVSTGPRPEEIEQAEDELSAANAETARAAADREFIRAGATEAEIAAARTKAQSAFMAQRREEDRYNVEIGWARNEDPDISWWLYPTDSDIPRSNEAIEDRAEALDLANRDLAAAQAFLDDLLDGPEPSDLELADAEVWVASAEQQAAQASLDLLLAGPRPEDITVAEAEVAESEAALEEARIARDRAILTAPFDGVVSQLSVRANEYVAPGQEIVLLAGSGDLKVETTDLNEIDVARVEVGDQVAVTFDALPGVTVNGTVALISPKSTEGAGVNFTVDIALEEIPPDLRWGMTAFVDITVE